MRVLVDFQELIMFARKKCDIFSYFTSFPIKNYIKYTSDISRMVEYLV